MDLSIEDKFRQAYRKVYIAYARFKASLEAKKQREISITHGFDPYGSTNFLSSFYAVTAEEDLKEAYGIIREIISWIKENRPTVFQELFNDIQQLIVSLEKIISRNYGSLEEAITILMDSLAILSSIKTLIDKREN